MNNLFLSGVVGSDIRANQVKEFLSKVDNSEITVYINSPGGDVFEGLEVYNLIKASNKHVTTVLTGLGASMGSIIFLAGDERIAMTGSMYMIHKPSSISFGDSDDMKKSAEVLDKIQESLQDIYNERTNITNIADYVNDESWFNVKEMEEHGIVNSSKEIKIESEEEMAKIDDLKAELEAEKAKSQEYADKLEEKELEKQIAQMKLENKQKKIQLETADEEVVDDVNADEDNELEREETIAEESTEPKKEDEEDSEEVIIDNKKSIVVESKTTIPAFMQNTSKY